MSLPALVVRCSRKLQAAKDEALLDDGSTICFEDRTPLGQVLLRSAVGCAAQAALFPQIS